MRIAVLDDYQQAAAGFADWNSLGADITFFDRHFDDTDELVVVLAGYDVVVAMRERTPLPATTLKRLPDLRLIVTTGQRNASIDIGAAGELGITVCATGYVSSPTLEHTWALILAAARHLPTEFAGVTGGFWQRTIGVGLAGRTLAVAGLGRLGSEVARIGLAFGMRVIAWSPHLTPERAEAAGVTQVSKQELLEQADILSIHLVLGATTRGLIGRDDLASMKPTAILVNTSRGPLVDEEALVEALQTGVIAAAAVDVFDVEPLAIDHPLRAMGNAILTPHLGYVVDTQYQIFFPDAVEDIRRFAAGDPIRVLTA